MGNQIVDFYFGQMESYANLDLDIFNFGFGWVQGSFIGSDETNMVVAGVLKTIAMMVVVGILSFIAT